VRRSSASCSRATTRGRGRMRSSIGPVRPRNQTIADRLTSSYGPVNLARGCCARASTRSRDVSTSRAWCRSTTPASRPVWGWLRPPRSRWRGRDCGDLSDVDTPITLPVYTSWRFATGEDGDFGSLAEQLIGVPAPWQIGRRLTADVDPWRRPAPAGRRRRRPAADDPRGRVQPQPPDQNSTGPAGGRGVRRRDRGLADGRDRGAARRAEPSEPTGRGDGPGRQPGAAARRRAGDLRPLPSGGRAGRQLPRRGLVRGAQPAAQEPRRGRPGHPGRAEGSRTADAGRVGAGRRGRRREPLAAVGPARPVRRHVVLRAAHQPAVVRRLCWRRPGASTPACSPNPA
jgi:hypothetical protein